MVYLYVGSGKIVRFENMRDADTGDYLNAGWTATWELWTATGSGTALSPGSAVPGATGSMTYEADSNGNYEGVIPDTITADLTAGSNYFVRGLFTDGVSSDTRWLPAQAVRRNDR